mmetsp:Transcript_4046/g.16918  ORF Transcript_4046/g.16918 Transcript_4046/m.16918 type:complete len:260 (+) Transcript_4046:968-1747(+)
MPSYTTVWAPSLEIPVALATACIASRSASKRRMVAPIEKASLAAMPSPSPVLLTRAAKLPLSFASRPLLAPEGDGGPAAAAASCSSAAVGSSNIVMPASTRVGAADVPPTSAVVAAREACALRDAATYVASSSASWSPAACLVEPTSSSKGEAGADLLAGFLALPSREALPGSSSAPEEYGAKSSRIDLPRRPWPVFTTRKTTNGMAQRPSGAWNGTRGHASAAGGASHCAATSASPETALICDLPSRVADGGGRGCRA